MRRGIFVASCLLVLLFAFAGSAQAARYDTDTVIVKYASGVTTAERLALFDSAGVSTVGSVAGVGAKVVRVSADPAVVAERLNRSALVDYAEPNFILSSTATPNDPLFPELYGMKNTGQTGGRADADIDAPEGWDAAGLGSFPAGGGRSPLQMARLALKSTPATPVALVEERAWASPPISRTASPGRTRRAPR